MKIEESKIVAFDKIQLFVKCWLPHDSIKGVIVLIHDLGDHINRYNHWARRFNNSGWAVVGMDLRGHGYSEGKRGCGSYQACLSDIHSLLHFVRKRFGDVPLVLYGHSFGGNLALAYEITRQPDISRLIVSSPWLKLSKEPSNNTLFLLKLFSKFFPSLSMGSGFHSQFISRDTSVCDEYRKDRLVHKKVSINLFLQIREWASIILKNKHKVNVPLLLIHGKNDQITSWKGSYGFARSTSESTHYKIWNDGYHELHNDVCRDEVYNYISFWLGNIQNTKLKVNVG
jgi:alpha-beta hydrolase superfamily lysophospholipase